MFRALVAFGLLYALWLPVQPGVTRLLAGAAEPVLRLVERPPLITSLAAEGNTVRFYSFLTGTEEPMASWSTETVGGFLLAPIALILVLAAPRVRRSTLVWIGGLVLLTVFSILVGIAVAQIKLAAATYASTELGIAVHTPTEQAWLKRTNETLYVLGMMGLPVFLFLLTYGTLRWVPPAGVSAGGRAGPWKKLSAVTILVVAVGWTSWFLLVPGPEIADPGASHAAGWAKILRLNPRFAPAQVNVGLQLAGDGRWDEAIELYRSAVSNDPGLAQAHFNLGTAWLEKKRHDRAVESLGEAVRLAPDHAEAHRNLALALSRLDRPCEALTHLKTSTRLNARFAREPAVGRAIETLQGRCDAG